MKIKGITDVFFDLDHTLWDFDKNSALTFNKIFKLNQIDIDLDEFLSYYEPINLEYWKLYREEKIEKDALRFARLNDVFMALGQHLEKDLIYKLSDDYILHLASFNHVFDDTFEILNYLNSSYNLHIITNGFEEVQQKKMEGSKISHFFKTITNSEMAGVKKPNPLIFNHALKLANVNAKQSIMIGDNYEADILGALDFGIDAIFFNMKSAHSENNVKQINKLIELKNYL